MNREIKFRAWDKERKIMIPSVSVMPLGGVLFLDGESKVGHVGAYAKNYKYLLGKRVEAMQYTNLKDKNGVEVYSSDIVSDGINPPFVVNLWNWLLMIRLSEIEFAVIGNIYQHPELLQK